MIKLILNNSPHKLFLTDRQASNIRKSFAEVNLEDSGLLINGITETVKNEIKEQKGGFLSMLLGTLGASLLGNLLTGKGINKKGKGINRAGEGIVRAGEGNKTDF